MKSALNKVKMNACRKATNNSRTSMKITNATDTGAMASDLKMKIREIKLNTIMCPAVIFANNLTINANGLESTPITSTGIMITYIHFGTSGAKMWLQ